MHAFSIITNRTEIREGYEKHWPLQCMISFQFDCKSLYLKQSTLETAILVFSFSFSFRVHILQSFPQLCDNLCLFHCFCHTVHRVCPFIVVKFIEHFSYFLGSIFVGQISNVWVVMCQFGTSDRTQPKIMNNKNKIYNILLENER